MEKWMPVIGYEEHYEVSSLGRFRSMTRGPIRCTPMHAGYLTVKLSKKGKAKTWRAHSLVLASFVGPRPAGAVTRHLNGKRDDNRIENLAWGTISENSNDAKLHGTFRSHYSGKHFNDHPNGKLSRPMVECIQILSQFFLQREIALIVGVHQSTISNALKNLKRLPPPEPLRIAGWDAPGECCEF